MVAALALASSGCGSAPSITPHVPEPPGQALPGREFVRADYETGGLQQWDGGQVVDDDRIQVVTDPVDQGRYAARFEVRDGDTPIAGYNDRAELQIDTDDTEGDDRWYAWSTRFAADFPVTDAWQVVAQWHADADGPPPVAFYVEGDRLELKRNPHDAPGVTAGDPVVVWSAPLRREHWYRIKMRVRWSGDDRIGRISLWIDGRRVVRGALGRTLYPGYPNYFKQGYYRRAGEPRTGVVFHDGFHGSDAVPAVSGRDD